MSLTLADATAHVALFASLDIAFHLFIGFTAPGAEFLYHLAEEFNLSGGLHGAEAVAHSGHLHEVASVSDSFAQGNSFASTEPSSDFFQKGDVGFEGCVTGGGETHFHDTDLICHPASA